MSRFLQEKDTTDDSFQREINFEDAIRLPDGGSTCEIYRTRWQRREVFVKRLKKEFRSNPLYLDALDKEYEIGVSLKHPSLPDYREFHRDYIVMDYIDGTTLADMIKNQDPWLRNERNILRLLKELVEVTEYLHRHNVTHCDIKADNIMISANNHNLILLDLDKCFTDSLNDTSGDPSKFGLTKDKKGRIAIDFHGIGRVVEKLKNGVTGFKFSRYSDFIKECYKSEPSTDELLRILDYKPGNPYGKFYWIATFVPFCVALLFGFVLWLTQGKGGYDSSYGVGIPVTQTNDSISIKAEEPKIENKSIEDKNDPNLIRKEPSAVIESKSQEEIHEEAKKMAVQLDERISPMFDQLNLSLDNLLKLKQNPDITQEQLLDSLRKHFDKEDEYCQETFYILNETFPGISEREAWRVMAYSKAYTGYKRRAAEILKNNFN